MDTMNKQTSCSSRDKKWYRMISPLRYKLCLLSCYGCLGFRGSAAMGVIFYLVSVLCLISGSQIYELKCWTQRNRTRYSGPGLQNSVINDTIECINKCRENDFCHVVDIDTNTKGNCWYQQNSSFVATESDLQPADIVTNYLYNPTCGKITRSADLNCWTVTPAHQILSEELLQLESLSVDDCLSLCKKRKNCWIVDWDVNSFRSCRIQRDPIHMPLSKLVAKDSVTNFILNRDCFNLYGPAVPNFWRVSADTQYTSPGLVQIDKWDIQSCINYCENNKYCTMFDFDPQARPPCRAQTSPFPILRGKLAEKSKVYNFLLSPKNMDHLKHGLIDGTWIILPNVGDVLDYDKVIPCWDVQDGQDYSEAGFDYVLTFKTDLNKCLKLCFNRPSCGAVTFDPSSNKPCSHVKGNVDKNKLSLKAGVKTYLPNRDCFDMDEAKKK